MTDLLKKTATYGAVSVVTAVGLLLQSKAISYLAGPSGFGVYSTALALATLLSTISQWGLSTTLVSFLSKAESNGPEISADLKERSASNLIQFSTAIGLIVGSLVFYCLDSSPVHRDWLLSLVAGAAVAMTTFSALNTSIFTARGQSRKYARIKISSTIISVPTVVAVYFWLESRAVIPALLAAAIPLAFFSRRAIKHKSEANPFAGKSNLFHCRPRIYRNLIKTSSAIALTSITSSLSSYLVLALVLQHLGTQNVGIFSAALAVSIANINFLLQAMALDYFPRLCKVIYDKDSARKLINTQIQFNLTLASPLLYVLLLFNKEIVAIFYSSEFSSAVSLVQVFVFCGFIRLIQWPMGFLQLAIPLRKTWIATQTLSSTLVVVMTLLLVPYLSLLGSAISYLAMYLVMLCVVGVVAYRSISFKPELETIKILIRSLVCLVLALGLALNVHVATNRLFLAFILSALSSGPSLGSLFPNHFMWLKSFIRILR